MIKSKEKFIELSNSGLSYGMIGDQFGISRQRVHQIITGYKPIIPAIEHKIFTGRKLKALFDFDTRGENPNKNGISGGVDYIREWARIRDRHTCQNCGKVWQKGERRLDVHHMDEKRESSDNNDKFSQANIITWDKNNLHKMITLCHKCHLNLDTVRLKMGQSKIKVQI